MKKLDVAKKMKGQPKGMIQGKSILKQKGKMSLESVGKNESEKHYLGKNEQPIA